MLTELPSGQQVDLPPQDVTAHVPIRPRPMPGEMAYGYLIRVAAANGYEASRSFWSALRGKYSTYMDLFDSPLCLSPAERAVLFGIYPRYCGIAAEIPLGLGSEDFHHQWMRWCPKCLSDAPYLRGEWGIKLCCVCVRHALVLRAQCPSCGELQRLERSQLGRCACGFDLTRSVVTLAQPQWVDLHRVLMNGLQRTFGKMAFELSPAAWVRLVKYLGQFDSEPALARPGQVAGLHELENALALTIGTASLLWDWPNSFHAFLARQRSHFPTAIHIGEAFGSFYRVLYRELDAPCFNFLRNAFEDYLRENWFGLLGRRNRRLNPSTVATHPRKPLGSIAKKSGTGRAIIRHLADAGAIRGNAVRHDSGRTTWSVPDDEALRVTAYLADHITMREAARLLGISRPRVRELINAGLMEVRIRRTEAHAATWLLSRSSAERLASLGLAVCDTSREADVARPCIELSKLLRTWRLRADEFPAMVSAIASGALEPLGRTQASDGLGALVLPVDDVREWLRAGRINADSWVSIDTAGKMLGVKQQVAYELVARGMLTVSAANSAAEGHRRVHRYAIDEFRRTYVSLAEIAKIRGTSPRRMLDSVAATPVCGPSVDGARQYFFRRSDVGWELSAGLETLPLL